MYPKHAIIAVTLNCNSRCVMCDIWKNHITKELLPHDFLKLPHSLIDINITGGEPFLRRDLVSIIANMKKAAPKARLIMNTNGFMPHRAAEDLPKIFAIDPKFALRVSVDGMREVHDTIRGIPGGFKKVIQTFHIARMSGLRDLGVSFTVLDQNVNEIPKVQAFCRKNNLEFSLTVATNSVIYFGQGKETMRPKNKNQLETQLSKAAMDHFRRLQPKEIVRGWFVKSLLRYIQTGIRRLPCDAGQGFFYMDSAGNVYTCHLKPWIMGNIKKHSLDQIFCNNRFALKVATCHGCWMVCTSKSMMKKQLLTIIPEFVPEVIRAVVHKRTAL